MAIGSRPGLKGVFIWGACLLSRSPVIGLEPQTRRSPGSGFGHHDDHRNQHTTGQRDQAETLVRLLCLGDRGVRAQATAPRHFCTGARRTI